MQVNGARRQPVKTYGQTPIRAIDLFSGAGGSSQGAEKAGVEIVAAFDLWDLARKTYKDNFPTTHVFGGRLEKRNAKALARTLGPVDLLLASPECTNHTCAKGSAKRDEASRATAFQVVKFARAFKPRWVVVENVTQMRSWKRYDKWKARLKRLGYNLSEQVLNAADFGVPQSRRRLYIVGDNQQQPPPIRPRKRKTFSAESILNLNGAYKFSPLFKKGRAKPTLERARRAMKELGDATPFLIVYYGSDAAGGWQRLTSPLRTLTTLDRFAYVKPSPEGPMMRMLQPPELKRAMGFRARYRMKQGCRRDNIKLLGNGVCPPVMTAIIRKLVRHGTLRKAQPAQTRIRAEPLQELALQWKLPAAPVTDIRPCVPVKA